MVCRRNSSRFACSERICNASSSKVKVQGIAIPLFVCAELEDDSLIGETTGETGT